MNGKVCCSSIPFCATRKIFSVCFSPGPPLTCICHLAFPCSQGCFSGVERGERRLASWGAGRSARSCLQPQLWGVSGTDQWQWSFNSLSTSVCLLLLQSPFVALVSRAMPAIAAYFVVCSHTFFRLFAPTVRKTWSLVESLCLPLAATTPQRISPLVD